MTSEKQRRNTVISQARINGYINEEEERQLLKKPLELRYQKLTNKNGPELNFVKSNNAGKSDRYALTQSFKVRQG